MMTAVMYTEFRKAWDELTGPGGAFEIELVPAGGTKIRSYATAPGSVRDLWLSTREHGSHDYLVYRDERWTYDAAHAEVASLAAWLAEAGVEPGDRVAIAMRNYPEWLLVYWATLSMGATAVGMNAWWTGSEMAYAIDDSRPKVIFCDQERLERLAAHRAEGPPLVVVAVRAPSAEADGVVPYAEVRGHGGALPDATVDPDSDACIFYTSGTTGRPKGARLTHRGCVANLWSIVFWGAVCERARALAGGAPAKTGDDRNASASGKPFRPVSLVTTPLFHVTANNCVAYSVTAAGGTLVLMYKWDADEALRLIERERVTNFTGVPTMTRELLAHPDLDAHDTSSLRIMGGGGASFQPDLVEKVEKRRGRTRPNTGYGLTETSGIITTTSADYHVDKPESVGPVMPCFEARCVDEDGNVLPPGGVGELHVKGAQVIAGYLNQPEATAEAITDGWFHTGDVARIDEDGFVTIVDRIKDMVLRGGENVYCSEVEAALFEHPDVAECAVFGVPDERLGEEVGAAVVAREAGALSAQALREHCAPLIAAFKIPRYLWIGDEPLPRNANGKFLKRELRDTLDPADAT
jgi:long-chain acyl-CoA synthetase